MREANKLGRQKVDDDDDSDNDGDDDDDDDDDNGLMVAFPLGGSSSTHINKSKKLIYNGVEDKNALIMTMVMIIMIMVMLTVMTMRLW